MSNASGWLLLLLMSADACLLLPLVSWDCWGCIVESNWDLNLWLTILPLNLFIINSSCCWCLLMPACLLLPLVSWDCWGCIVESNKDDNFKWWVFLREYVQSGSKPDWFTIVPCHLLSDTNQAHDQLPCYSFWEQHTNFSFICCSEEQVGICLSKSNAIQWISSSDWLLTT